MRVAAALVWYSETVDALTRCAESLTGYCDSLVALGGRWDGFPEIEGDDIVGQSDALVDACLKNGMLAQVSAPVEPWCSQVEKRAELMKKACALSDWVLVIDGDEFIESGDPKGFRKALESTGLDVGRVFARRLPIPYGRKIHRVYRSSAKVTVKTAHNGYVTADGRFLNGDPCYVDLPDTVDLDEHLRIAHDLTARGQNRKVARAEYNRFRRKTRIEAWT